MAALAIQLDQGVRAHPAPRSRSRRDSTVDIADFTAWCLEVGATESLSINALAALMQEFAEERGLRPVGLRFETDDDGHERLTDAKGLPKILKGCGDITLEDDDRVVVWESHRGKQRPRGDKIERPTYYRIRTAD